MNHISIPALRVSAPIVRNVSGAELAHGAGHYPGTAWPGQRGTTAFAGHDVTYVPEARGGHVFNRVAAAYRGGDDAVGDLVVIWWRGRRYEYRVTAQRAVSPTDVDVLRGPRYGQRLVLTTCYPPRSAARRLVTIAWRVRPFRRRGPR